MNLLYLEWFTSEGFAGIMVLVFIALLLIQFSINQSNVNDLKDIAKKMNENKEKDIETRIKHTTVLEDIHRLLEKKI